MLLNKGHFSVGENAFPNVTLEHSEQNAFTKVTLERSDRVSIVYYFRLAGYTIILVKEYCHQLGWLSFPCFWICGDK